MWLSLTNTLLLLISYSDVWAFGVTCFEILNRSAPYPMMKPVEVAVAVLTKGLTPTLPSNTPKSLAQIIRPCYSFHAADRPTMVSLHSQLSELQP
jgi:serine/threonine protein kinase